MPISPSARLRIAVTLGDPAGIGPEVTLKALARTRFDSKIDFLLLGKASFYSALARRLGLSLRFRDVAGPDTLLKSHKEYPCYFHGAFFPEAVGRGRADSRWARLAVESIRQAVGLALEGQVAALVTPPINKAAILRAGLDIPGHTEFLAKLTGTKRYEMMLVGKTLRVVLVTRHLALRQVPGHLTQKRIADAIRLTDWELQRTFGINNPKIVVCGLNPHAGEEGYLGREEITTIAPAVRSVRSKLHSTITGPLSPDALFHDAYLGKYDAEICMYHDQGLIPLKMISRGCGVNVTLGLPFVRTSPDHGTGYDIANRFVADSGSMAESMKLAATLALQRRKYDLAHLQGKKRT